MSATQAKLSLLQKLVTISKLVSQKICDPRVVKDKFIKRQKSYPSQTMTVDTMGNELQEL